MAQRQQSTPITEVCGKIINNAADMVLQEDNGHLTCDLMKMFITQITRCDKASKNVTDHIYYLQFQLESQIDDMPINVSCKIFSVHFQMLMNNLVKCSFSQNNLVLVIKLDLDNVAANCCLYVWFSRVTGLGDGHMVQCHLRNQ